MFLIPSDLQWHCPGMTLFMVVVVVLQTTQAATLRPDAARETIVLGLEMLGMDNYLGNRWILSEADAPYLCCDAQDGDTTNFALVAPMIKAW
jgi:hypothetical protein